MSEDALKILEIAAEIWRLKYLKAEDDLAKAVLEEREACAKLLEDNWFRTQAECIDAIRARGEVK